MSRRTILGAVITLVALWPGDVQGCGDKFFVPGRGVRFPRTIVDRASAAVLLYAPSGSALSKTITSLSVDTRLRASGYRPTYVTSEAALNAVLRTSVWDIVVVELADVADVQSRLSKSPSTVVLGVSSDGSRTMPTGAGRAHQQVLKSPKRDRAFVDALDKIVAERARAKKELRGA